MMSTDTASCTDIAAAARMAHFVGKYVMTIAGGDDRHAIFLTAKQTWEKFFSAESDGTLSLSEEDPGQGFSFVVTPRGAEGPGQLWEVVPLDDWMLRAARQARDNTPETLARVLECLRSS